MQSDRGRWLPLWSAWQQHMRSNVPSEIADRTWRLFFEPDSKLSCLVADDAGALRGFAVVSLTPFAWTADPVVFLQDFYIDEPVRGSGVGGMLLRGVYDFADVQGACNVFWFVDEDDARLQGFYDRHALRTPYLRYMRRPWPY